MLLSGVFSKVANRASKSRRSTDMGGCRRIGTFPPILNFAATARYRVLKCDVIKNQICEIMGFVRIL